MFMGEMIGVINGILKVRLFLPSYGGVVEDPAGGGSQSHCRWIGLSTESNVRFFRSQDVVHTVDVGHIGRRMGYR